MRVAVLGGGGAMGGIFGSHLKEAGNDVVLVDVSPAAVDAINTNGLKVDARDGTSRVVRIGATSQPDTVGEVDLIINFVKCYHTEAAIRSAVAMMGADTAFLTLQNGWGNADVIGGLVGKERVVVGLTYHSGTMLAPGHIKHPGVGVTYVGELDGGATPRLQSIVAAFRGAGFETVLSNNVIVEVWKKLALNACTLPTSALLRFHAHQLAQFDGVKDEMRAILGEVVAVAQASDIALDFDERWHATTGLLEKAVGAKASMLQDVEARRRTEIDVINGAIVRAGANAGVPTPHNIAMTNMIRGLEAAYLQEAVADAA